MKQIKTFTVEHDFDDVHLAGICRWIGNSLQVELTEPFDGIVGTNHLISHKMKLTDMNIVDYARDELELFYLDFTCVVSAPEKYRELVKNYGSYRHKITRMNAELNRTLEQLEQAYSDHHMSRKDYGLQCALVHEAIRAGNSDLEHFARGWYAEHRELSQISPDYVAQLLNWMKRNPAKARKLKEHHDKMQKQIQDLLDPE